MKAEFFKILNHLYSTPPVEGDLTDIEPLTELLDEFFNTISPRKHVGKKRNAVSEIQIGNL